MLFPLTSDEPGERLPAVQEKALQSGTQIVESGKSVRRFDKAVFGTTPVAHGQDFAFPAIMRETVALCITEISLRLAFQHLFERCFADVPSR